MYVVKNHLNTLNGLKIMHHGLREYPISNEFCDTLPENRIKYKNVCFVLAQNNESLVKCIIWKMKEKTDIWCMTELLP